MCSAFCITNNDNTNNNAMLSNKYQINQHNYCKLNLIRLLSLTSETYALLMILQCFFNIKKLLNVKKNNIRPSLNFDAAYVLMIRTMIRVFTFIG